MANVFPDPAEAADSVSPATVSFKMDDGRATAPFNFEGLDDDADFRNRVLDVLGFNRDGSDGRIVRVLPAQYGLTRFLYASSVNLVGYGRLALFDAPAAEGDDPGDVGDDDLLDPEDVEDLPKGIRARPLNEHFAVYDQYQGAVEFLQRPYHVLPNDQIETEFSTWFDDEGEERPYYFAAEWKRYTETDESFSPKVITATQGQLTFFTDNGAQPHRQSFAGTPRIPFAESALRITWRQVPYRYVSSRNSFLKRFANRVNQWPWRIQDYAFEPGELLYLGFDPPRRYTPPFPFADPAFDDERFALEKWCDLTLNFLVARRSAPNPPGLPNQNFIANGHNTLPWFGSVLSKQGRKFHYVGSFNPRFPNDPNYWAPIFYSFPVEILFTDPDAPQPEGFL